MLWAGKVLHLPFKKMYRQAWAGSPVQQWGGGSGVLAGKAGKVYLPPNTHPKCPSTRGKKAWHGGRPHTQQALLHTMENCRQKKTVGRHGTWEKAGSFSPPPVPENCSICLGTR